MTLARPVGWLGRTRRTLREERNVLDVLLDNLDVAVVACGPDGHVTHLGEVARAWTCWSRPVMGTCS